MDASLAGECPYCLDYGYIASNTDAGKHHEPCPMGCERRRSDPPDSGPLNVLVYFLGMAGGEYRFLAQSALWHMDYDARLLVAQVPGYALTRCRAIESEVAEYVRLSSSGLLSGFSLRELPLAVTDVGSA